MLEREAGIVVRRNARPIVLDFNGIEPLVLETDLDAGGAGVQTVLDELFCNGAEVDNDLARLDAMDLSAKLVTFSLCATVKEDILSWHRLL